MPIPPPVETPLQLLPEAGTGARVGGGVSARRLLRPALLLLALLAVGLVLRHLPNGGLPGAAVLRDGLRGRLLFVCAGSLVCAVGMPRQAVCFAGGLAYGLYEAIALSSLATTIGCLAGWSWARFAGRGGWAGRRLAGRAGRWLDRLDRMATGRPFATILTVRLLPVGSSLALNLAAGLLGVSLLPFLAATLIGSLPQTVIFCLLGGGTRIGHLTQAVLAVILFALSGALGLVLLRRNQPG